MTCSSCGLALKFDRWSLARSFSWKLSNSSPVQKKWLKNVDRWAVGHAPGPKHTTTNFGRDRRTFPSSDSKHRRPRRTDVDIGDKGRRALPSTIMTLGGVLLRSPLPRHAASQDGVVVYDVLTRYRTCLTFVLLLIMLPTVGKGAINVAFVRPSVRLSVRPSRIIREPRSLAWPLAWGTFVPKDTHLRCDSHTV